MRDETLEGDRDFWQSEGRSKNKTDFVTGHTDGKALRTAEKL
jgi:hypothetical protein